MTKTRATITNLNESYIISKKGINHFEKKRENHQMPKPRAKPRAKPAKLGENAKQREN